ncbi:MAG: hypothetical protein H6658_05475 [Ardenticatenaceae bacterium]|nr:hypothetical protein [Ardenticatenaceae bacterium]
MMTEQSATPKLQLKTFGPLWFLLGFVLAVVWVWVGLTIRPSLVRPFFGPIISTDINQARLNTAVPIPQGSFAIEQTFVPRWDGLREIELILVRYEEADEEEDGRFTLQLTDENDQLIAESSLQTGHIQHNQTHLFRFPAQAHSAGQTYTLRLSGSDDNTVTVWGYDVDVYGPGAMQLVFGDDGAAVAETAVQDLRFLTRTQLTWRDALIALRTRFLYDSWLIFLTLIFIPLPGCLLLLVLRNRGELRGTGDVAAWWGLALALGIAIWPLLWYGVTLLNGRITNWLLWLLLIVGWSAAFFLWQSRRERTPLPARRSPLHWQHAALLLLLLLSLATRFLAVRDLDFPAWVDASRHGLITAVMTSNGQTPTDYAPYLPTVARFPYHFGFHTLAASLQLMTDWPLPQLLLVLGQLLNGLMPLLLYTAVYHITRRPTPALLAAFLVGLPFFFPAYYATWGRFTQLTAMLIMPVLLAATWRLLRGETANWWLVGLLATGLFYVHFRVFLLYLPFVPIAWIVNRARQTGWLALATAVSLLLTAPRLYQLWVTSEPTAVIRSTITNYNLFPFSYVQTGWEQQFLWLAALGFLLCLAAWWQRHQWPTLPLTLVGWIATLFILLAGERLNLPETSLININSMYITVFVPLAIFLAIVAVGTWRWLLPPRLLWQIPATILLGSLIALTTLFGIRQQITILNSQTILAQTADLPALLWAKDNLPAEAKVAVNSWQWLGDTWAGSDGGAWLVPLTGLTSTTPPADYLYNLDLFLEVKAFNEGATAVSDWSLPEPADWLRQQGVTHIFIGAKGGFFDPAALLKNPHTRLIYGHDSTFIFELLSE